MNLELPKLNYAFDALEPYIDAKTMEIHYTKHHQAYFDNFKKAIQNYPELLEMTAIKIVTDINKLGTTLNIPASDLQKIKNHGGGYLNHNLYWSIMGPEKELNETLIKKINAEFGSVENFKGQFNETAGRHFGSGWAWLVEDSENKLKIYTLPNQDSPYTLGDEPLIALDLWEHAYYLKYQNRRPDYIENWWQVVKII